MMSQQEQPREIQEIWELFRETDRKLKELTKTQEETVKQVLEDYCVIVKHR